MNAPDLSRVRAAIRAPGWPTEEITLDMGEFGEVTATVEYDPIPAEPGDYYQPARPAYVILGSVVVDGIGDLLPFIKKLHPDTLHEIEHKVHAKLRGRAS